MEIATHEDFIDTVTRFDSSVDHHFRHNPGLPDTERNNPNEADEIDIADFIDEAMSRGLLTTTGNTYSFGNTPLATGRRALEDRLLSDPELVNQIANNFGQPGTAAPQPQVQAQEEPDNKANEIFDHISDMIDEGLASAIIEKEGNMYLFNDKEFSRRSDLQHWLTVDSDLYNALTTALTEEEGEEVDIDAFIDKAKKDGLISFEKGKGYAIAGAVVAKSLPKLEQYLIDHPEVVNNLTSQFKEEANGSSEEEA
jgi:hypothetical protein